MGSSKIKKMVSFVVSTAITVSTVLTPSFAAVYNVEKTARWSSPTNIDINLSCDFDAEQNITNGNVLFIGSRCSAHGMRESNTRTDPGYSLTTVIPKSINAMSKYANVKWYTYGNVDPEKYNQSGLVNQGDNYPYGTIDVTSDNHNVADKFAECLYNELANPESKKEYNLIVLEFDGNKIFYNIASIIDDTKLGALKEVLDSYYDNNKVIWVVPDDTKKSQCGGFPYTSPEVSNPNTNQDKFSKYVLNGGGYTNPNQKDYNNVEALEAYLSQYVLGFYGKTTFTDTVAEGLTINSVIPQFKDNDGKWKDVTERGVIEGTYGKKITATVTRDDKNDRKITVLFDTALPELAASNKRKYWNHSLRILIKCNADSSFTTLDGTDTKETNEGNANISFSEAKDGTSKSVSLNLSTAKVGKISLDLLLRPKDISVTVGQGAKLSLDIEGLAEVDKDILDNYEPTFSIKNEGGTTVSLSKALNKAGNYTIYWENSNEVSVDGSVYPYSVCPTLTGTLTVKGTVKTPTYTTSSGSSKYTVNFETNGGSTVKRVSVLKNTIVSDLPIPTKDGHYFAGWYKEPELVNEFNGNEKVTRNMKIYAKWVSEKEAAENNMAAADIVPANGKLIMKIGEKDANVWGNIKTSDVAPIIRNGSTMLPARFVTENLGGMVTWSEIEEKITIKKDNTLVYLFMNSDVAIVNGTEVKLDVPVYFKDGRTYIPVRFVAEQLGYRVDWNAATKEVIILK